MTYTFLNILQIVMDGVLKYEFETSEKNHNKLFHLEWVYQDF